MKLIVTRKRFGRWYVRIVAANGLTLAHTETYYSKANARRAAVGLATAAWASAGITVEEQGGL